MADTVHLQFGGGDGDDDGGGMGQVHEAREFQVVITMLTIINQNHVTKSRG